MTIHPRGSLSRRDILRLAGALTTVAVASACGGTEPTGAASTRDASPSLLAAKGEPLTKATVSAGSTSVNHMWARWGITHGIYKKFGLDVEAVDGIADAVAAMASGQLQFSAAGVQTHSGAVRGAPVRAVMLTFRDNLGLYTTKGISSLRDLAGKRVFGPNDMIKEILRRAGVDPDKGVTWVQTQANTKQIIQLVQNGQADGFTGYPPAKLLAEDAGMREITSVSAKFPGSPVSIVGTPDQLISDNPLLVKRFLAGTLETLDHMLAHEDEVLAFFHDEWGFDDELARGCWDVVQHDMIKGGKSDDKSLQVVLDVTKAAQGKKDDIPLDRVWDFSLLDQVVAERAKGYKTS
ncbi:ABC transporter substrate-binding protein [Actinophytocola oryzae]|uniref:ABC-type nitrate/sulfonate/bicarbonate transport system substrate-binding protein n=1 Tax=Actinophytocola oryzae TaxID=502181 RepID=A0A4R7W1S0_9PSEU|nr:ABC transporter substrate-binding protein [Actinophytocola oryzae]TDV56362.1 ABC-type nitrate/sulfonate/bicarbonate transport system substrate-binding protein [Actinophytocola oryzae]